MRDAQELVREFHRAADLPVRTTPGVIANDELESIADQLYEELGETIDALEDEDVVGVADGIADLVYVALGLAVRCGIELEPIFNEVARSNASKGPFLRGPTGKVRKGPNYEPPALEPILHEQGWDGDLA